MSRHTNIVSIKYFNPEGQQNSAHDAVCASHTIRDHTRCNCWLQPPKIPIRMSLIAVTFLLSSCLNIAGIKWQDESANTNWAAANNQSISNYSDRVSQLHLMRQGYVLNEGKLVNATRLNDEGLQVMETNGCIACHHEGGRLPAMSSVIKYKHF